MAGRDSAPGRTPYEWQRKMAAKTRPSGTHPSRESHAFYSGNVVKREQIAEFAAMGISMSSSPKKPAGENRRRASRLRSAEHAANLIHRRTGGSGKFFLQPTRNEARADKAALFRARVRVNTLKSER